MEVEILIVLNDIITDAIITISTIATNTVIMIVIMISVVSMINTVIISVVTMTDIMISVVSMFNAAIITVVTIITIIIIIITIIIMNIIIMIVIISENARQCIISVVSIEPRRKTAMWRLIGARSARLSISDHCNRMHHRPQFPTIASTIQSNHHYHDRFALLLYTEAAFATKLLRCGFSAAQATGHLRPQSLEL